MDANRTVKQTIERSEDTHLSFTSEFTWLRLRSYGRSASALVAFFLSATLGIRAQQSTAVTSFSGNSQHTANYQQPGQNLNSVHWSTSVDLNNNGAAAHYGAPLISAANTVFVPVKTADGFRVNALNGSTGAQIYTVSTDYVLPAYNWFPSYGPALATTSTGTRLYFPGAGGTIYYKDNPDTATASPPVQEAFYGLANYRANATAFNSSVYIDTPITSDNGGNIYFGFRVQGMAPAPLATPQSGFARIDSVGNATYVLAAIAAGDAMIGRDSHNSAPALSNDESTLYVLAKASGTDSYAYLLGLDSSTLATKYKTLLFDPRNGNYATVTDDSTASPVVAPDNDVYIGVLGNPNSTYRGFLLHFSFDLSVSKVPGAFGWDYTPGIVPAAMVPSYTGTSPYLILSKYNNYAGADDGDGINKIALLDPNGTQVDPHPSANGLTEMREVLTVTGSTPDPDEVSAGYPLAVREWCVNSPAVNPATNSIFAPSEDGHIYRWDLTKNSFSQVAQLAPGIGDAYVPVVIGPDGTVYTISGGVLFAVGDGTGVSISLSSDVQDLRSIVSGQPLTFTASVTDTGVSRVIPTGTVTFQTIAFQNGLPITQTLAADVLLDSAGHASITAGNLTSGPNFITVIYSGNTQLTTGSSTMVEMVHESASTTTIASSIDRADPGQTVTFIATVTPASSGPGEPTGMVTFEHGTDVLAQVPLNGGTASFVWPASDLGSRDITALYSSDSDFAMSSGRFARRATPFIPFDSAPDAPSVVSEATAAPDASPRAGVQSQGVVILGSSSSGLLSGSANYAANPANLTTEGTVDWIHWGETAVNRKATGGVLGNYTIINNTGLWYYANDPRLLSWTDGTPTATGSNDPTGIYLADTAGAGFSITAPADTTVRTLVVHGGGYFSASTLTAHLSDSSAPDFVDTTSAFTSIYDRNYILTYKAGSPGQTLTVSWVETTDLGAGNIDLNAVALSTFSGAIAPTSGNSQTATPGGVFATALQALVTDANNNPVIGATVTFTAPTGGATASFRGVSSVTAVTGTNGIAMAPSLTANSTTGSYYVIASVSGIPITASFSLTNAAGTPVSITPAGGTPGDAVVNTPYTTALQALVTDASNNPVNGITVTFSAPASGPSASLNGATTATAVTNASGVVFAPALTANSQAGSYVVTATAAPGVTTAFSLTNTSGGNGSLTGSANNSNAPVDLTAVGTSDWIHWGDASLNRKASGGSQISTTAYAFTQDGGAQSQMTVRPASRAAGNAQSDLTSSKRGTSRPLNMGVELYENDPRLMSWNDGTPTGTSTSNGDGLYIDYGTYVSSGRSGFVFTAPADGNTRTLNVYAGGNDTGGTLVAHLSDASAPDFVDTTPLASGVYDRNYSFTYHAGGPGQTLTVTWAMSASSGNGNVSLSAAALLSNTVGPPASITATVGTPQSATVNTAFTTALQATVKDANGNPVDNVMVTFTAPATGATAAFSGSATATASTNSNGIATAPALTANSQVGGYSVTASVAGVSATAGFSLSNTAVVVGPPASITATMGTPQSATVNTAFATALQATVRDSNGNPATNAMVTFTAPATGASAAFSGSATAIAATNSSGIATAPAPTANSQVGGYSVTASVSGVSTAASFALSNTAVSYNGVRLVQQATGSNGGNNQNTLTVALGTAPAVSDVLVLMFDQVDASQTITSISGATWTRVAQNYSGNNGDSEIWVGTSPSSSIITITGTNYFGIFQPGYAIVGEFSGLSPTPDGAALLTTGGIWPVSTGTLNTSSAGDLLITSALSYNGGGAQAAIGGAWTLFQAPGGTYSLAGAWQVVNATGSYSATWNGNGTPQVSTIILALKATGSASPPPASITATAGTAQSATVNTAFATALQATVKDATGSPVSNTMVTFTAPATGASAAFSGSATATATTNTSGIATAPAPTANGQVGGYTVIASVAGVSATAGFSLSNTAVVVGPPASITATFGTPQSASVNTAFTTALQATVKDANGNPVNNAMVTFTAPAIGASAAFSGSATATASTNANGIATAPALTANGQVGSYSVTASVAGVSTLADFSLSNTAVVGPPASITATFGTPQSAAVNTVFATALQATVKDANGNPVNNVMVTFTAPATGPSAAFSGSATATASTNSNGIATAPALTANGQAGNYTVTASVAGVSTLADFSLSNTAVSSNGIRLVQQAAGANGGNNQNTLTVTLGTAPAASDVLVLMFDQVDASQTITSISGATWTRVVQNYTGNNGDSEIWVGTNPSSSTITITGTNYFGIFQPGYAIVGEFSGLSPTLDGAALLTAGSIWPVSTGTLSTSTAGDLLITSALSYNGGGAQATISSAWTPFQAPGGTYSLAGAWQVVNATGSYSATWNGNGSARVSTIILALKATGAN